MKLGIIYHEKFRKYDLGSGHPLRGDRFTNVMSFLKEKGFFNSQDILLLKPKMASWKELVMAHTEDYIKHIFHLAKSEEPYDLETPVTLDIIEALLFIIGGSIEAGNAIYENKVNRAVTLGGGFHHAGRNYGGGLCIFNDVSIVTMHLLEKIELNRVLIFDFDVHFGNGTSDIFYSDPNVLYISLHQDPRTIYPGTGFIEQIGDGDGKGFNVNVPLPPRTGEKTYMYALREIFVPLAEEYRPDIIISNGGSDAHFADALGSLGLTTTSFFELSRIVSNTAEKVCNGKLILILGSGYDPIVLPYCWYALIAGVSGLERIDVIDPYLRPKDP